MHSPPWPAREEVEVGWKIRSTGAAEQWGGSLLFTPQYLPLNRGVGVCD